MLLVVGGCVVVVGVCWAVRTGPRHKETSDANSHASYCLPPSRPLSPSPTRSRTQRALDVFSPLFSSSSAIYFYLRLSRMGHVYWDLTHNATSSVLESRVRLARDLVVSAKCSCRPSNPCTLNGCCVLDSMQNITPIHASGIFAKRPA